MPSISGAGSDCGKGSWSVDCKSWPTSWSGSFAPSRAIDLALSCHAARCRAGDGLADQGHAGFALVRRAVLTVTDPRDQPGLAVSGSLVSAAGTWISGVADGAGPWTVRVSASDPAGICGLRASIVPAGGSPGSAVAEFSRDHRVHSSWLLPCGRAVGRSLFWAPELAGLANGSYVLVVSASNPAGGTGTRSFDFELDNQPPPAIGTLAVASPAGPTGWSASRTFDLSWATLGDLSGPQSPLATVSSEVCDATGGGCGAASSQPVSPTGASVQIPSGAPAGVYEAGVWITDQAGNQGQPAWGALRYDPGPPSAVVFGPSRPAVLGHAQLQVPETLSATAGPSGVYGYEVTVDTSPTGGVGQVNSFGSYDLSNLTSGVHTIYARAFSGAGVPGPVASVQVDVDRSAP